MKEIRLLTAAEIECRVGQCGSTDKGAWCSLLLYKDARCDQKILDDVFGIFGWKKSYTTINGNLFCTVEVYDPDKKEWISKQDVGTKSNTEAEKGEASDAFKRACVCVGIGRELYTAPKIFISLRNDEVVEKGGKLQLKSNVIFNVSEIAFDENRSICSLTIVDKNGSIRYQMGVTKVNNSDSLDTMHKALKEIEQAADSNGCKKVWDTYPQLQKEQYFIDAINNRLAQVA